MDPYIDIHSHDDSMHSLPERIVLHSYRLGSDEPLPEHPFSAGIHPWDAGRVVGLPALLHELAICAAVAVGETGLDYAKGRQEANIQEELFRSQLEIASQRNLPVIIHCVRAFEQTLSILKDYRLTGVIFHGYIGSPQQTTRVIDAEYHISAGNISFRSPKTVTSLRTAPLDRLFLETDDSGLPIEALYSTASEILELPLTELRHRIYQNFKKLFPYHELARKD